MSIPQPRSYSAIVGSMVDALLARLGIPSLRVGSPALSIIEAAAQSDLRSSQDIFNLLNSLSLDRSVGIALDRIGQDEEVTRIAESPASGVVTISDSSFEKKETLIYQGTGSPIVGSTTINVENTTGWPGMGQLYIGRGTTSYEGPLAYTLITNNITYYTITLATGTTRFHQLGEKVILAQGGDRGISANTLVKTSQGNAGSAVTFATRFAATILDGETEVTNIPVVAQLPGVIGNVVANSLVEFSSAPFAGATVTNPTPFSTGLSTEDDDTYRERIRDARASRTKGTPLAIKSAVQGITALDENKRVLSSSLILRTATEPSTLYIDDGTGYEEKVEGIAFEVIEEDATGGEQYFELVEGRPVAKAFLATTLSAPFTILPDSRLSVTVGGVVTSHDFGATDFIASTNASAYEVVASINQDPDILWNARITDNGLGVAIQAKAETNEDIQVVTPESGFDDANDNLGFPSDLARTLWLYKNDRLLSKDGQEASVTTKAKTLWGTITGSTNNILRITVDGIGPTDYTFVDADFINANTGFSSVSQANSLDSWATVFNSKIPGITATVSNGALLLTSNLGRNDRASVEIDTAPANDMAAQIFSTTPASFGVRADYTLDRNLGQIKLATALAEGDRLTAGSASTRGFVQTEAFTSLTISATEATSDGSLGAELWFVVDGAATVVPTGLSAGISVDITQTGVYTYRARYTAVGAFENVERGDWLINNDTAFSTDNRGAFRIANVDADWIEVDRASAVTLESVALATGNFRIVRTEAVPQKVVIAPSTYTTSGLATEINSQLDGATAETYRTTTLRVRTNTYGSDGDLAVVGGNVGGLALLGIQDYVQSGANHLASVSAGNSEVGTPEFQIARVVASTGPTNGDLFTAQGFTSGHLVASLKPHYLFNSPSFLGSLQWGNWSYSSPLEFFDYVTTEFNTRVPVNKEWLIPDKVYAANPFGISARDQLGLVMNGDQVSGRYVFDMFRKTEPDATTNYSTLITLTDSLNNSQSLAYAFGPDFDWKDFAVHMKARTFAEETLVPGSGILWRYYRHGAEGNYARVKYTNATGPLAPVAVSTSSTSSTDTTDIEISLLGGAERTPVNNVRNTSYLGYYVSASAAGVDTYTIIGNMDVTRAARCVVADYTVGAGSFVNGDPVTQGGVTGNIFTANTNTSAGQVYIYNVSGGSFVPGVAIVGGSGSITPTAVSSSAYVALRLDTLTAISHGISAGDVMWFDVTSGGFITGPKLITHSNFDTGVVAYSDGNPVTSLAPDVGPGTLSFDTSGKVDFSGASIVNGDLFAASIATGLHPDITNSNSSVVAGFSDQNFDIAVEGITGVGTVISWAPINNKTNVKWFQPGTNTVASLAAAVNALETVVSGVEVGVDSTTITPKLNKWFALTDGLNWVKSHTTPSGPNYAQVDFTLKDDVTSVALTAAGLDWENEDVRLVPTTAKNVADYLAAPGVSGLFGKSTIQTSHRSGKPQIVTTTPGSDGVIAVDGGNANVASATVVGAAVLVSGSPEDRVVVTVEDSAADGFTGDTWFSLDNQLPGTKSIFTSSTTLTSIVNAGTLSTVSLGVGNARTAIGSAANDSVWHIERQGRFTAFSWFTNSTPFNVSGVTEGSWVVIEAPTTPGVNPTDINSLNQGVFRVVRTEYDGTVGNEKSTFWIENDGTVEETSKANVSFWTYDSIMPGDTLVIGNSLWGSSNIGRWTVHGFGPADNQFVVDGPMTASAGAGPMGSASSQFQIYEKNPGRLIKKLMSISPNGSYVDLKFTTPEGYEHIGASLGTVVSALDKLAFGINTNTGTTVSIFPGSDGYSHNTGLIAEANKVVYGDDIDTGSYPGVAAAGASINIQGPFVKRIQVSLALRVKTGISIQDISDKVKSAVAAVINKTGVGVPVAISDLVSAAQSVNGVVAVTVLSPEYGVGSDLISVQPFEKPYVLSVSDDILVSFVGE